MTARGRPPLVSNAAILDAALTSFANLGYDATSVRAINAELGLSHETITQRFGTKPELFRAAVRHGIQQFVNVFDSEVDSNLPTDDLERLQAVVRAFIIAASRHTNLGELLHQRALPASDRAELMNSIGLDARIIEVTDLLARLRRESIIGDVSTRELWFLVQAGAAPLNFPELASMFDPVDGSLDPSRHVDRMVEIIMRALGVRADR